MDKLRYMISDAATMVNVETHVLRYWEEELELKVPRNEMGVRRWGWGRHLNVGNGDKGVSGNEVMRP